jgi:hypothetical protein
VFRHFRGSIVFTIAALSGAAYLGYYSEGTVQAALAMLWVALVLGVMETSLSLDNAVVNATVLKRMSPFWQKMFLTVGILIAVFGMRIVFPLLIVAVAGQIGFFEAGRIALEEPEHYKEIITAAHVGISGFGGAFLALVGLTFFFDSDKDVHWAPWIEEMFARAGGFSVMPYALTALMFGLFSFAVAPEEMQTYLVSASAGVATFFAVKKISALLEVSEKTENAVARVGLGAFLYLEVLDASFSFDGVIGAFALSNNIILIGLGLGIGAMFVRSLTVLLVKEGTLNEYRYLEHGAFWAILALAGIMMVSPLFEMPQAVTGFIGAALIAAAFVGSKRYNERDPEEVEDGRVVLSTYVPAPKTNA